MFAQFPAVMKPVLESVDAVSCTCEQTLTEMSARGPSAEHYNMLEVQSYACAFSNVHLLKIKNVPPRTETMVDVTGVKVEFCTLTCGTHVGEG